MTLRDYLRVLRRTWIYCVAVFLVCLGTGVSYVFLATKQYEATARIFVATSSSDDPAQLAQGNTFTQARVQSYTSIATSPAVTGPVRQELKLTMDDAGLSGKISADAPLNKVVINLHVTDTDPEQAKLIANAVAERFSVVVQQLERTKGLSQSPVKLTVTKPAQAPSGPVSPVPVLDIGLAVLLGLVLAGGLVALRAALQNDVRTPLELQDATGLAVLGIVPKDRKLAEAANAFRGDPHGRRAEVFRSLRTNLQFIDVDRPPRVVAVCSALPQEGKTLTSLNLAASLAEAGQRVCLVEADLRRPKLGGLLGVVGEVGLTSVLVGAIGLRDALQYILPNFTVLPSGAVPPNPGELLASARAHDIVTSLEEMFDYVVLDTAPLLPVADGSVVAALAQATLLVVRSGRTSREQITGALAALHRVDVTPVGAILSMAPAGQSATDYYYEYGSTASGGRHAGAQHAVAGR